jgi:hypothetical protein
MSRFSFVRITVVAATAFAVTSSAMPSRAQQAAAPAPATPPPTPTPGNDVKVVVTLKKGTIFRGTLVELVAGDHVTLQTPTGETKRFANADVASVHADGPGAPVEAPVVQPPGAAQANATKVHFEAKNDETDLFVQAGATMVGAAGGGGGNRTVKEYEHVCGAPCDASLTAGKHRLALAFRDRDPVQTGEVTLEGPVTLKGSYDDKRGLRTAGWIVFGVGLGAGASLVAGSLASSSEDCSKQWLTGFCTGSSPKGALLGAGLGTIAVGAVVGLAMVLLHDHADIEVVPATAQGVGSLMPRREADMRVGPFDFSEPGLTMRF